MSCNCRKPKCDGKCGISPAVLQINNNDCTLFHRVEIPAAMGDEKTNPPKTGVYRNVLLYYAASGNSYLYSSDGIPTKLTGVVSDYEVLLNKPWINGVELIGNKTLADLGIISAIDTAVAVETMARANADNALSSRISTNTGKINTNTTAIANEKTARENADTALQNNISAESQARIDADAGLQSQINSTSGAVAAERDARILADNALGTRIDNVSGSVTDEENARIDADAGLQDQIDAVRSTAESALTPDDIDYTVMTDVDVSANTSTNAVNLDGSKVNLKTGTTSSKIISLPVASSTQAGVMNSSTFNAISSNTNNIQAILNGAVAVNGLPANPTQAQLTTAWQNETGLSTLINRASIYDVTNSKVWTYYTNDSTWHAAANSSQVTVNTFTNSSEGLIKGSTNVGQVFAESDGTGSVNGWDALSDAVNDATTKLAGIQNGAEQNVQSDWNVTDTSSDAYIKNKPTIPTVNNGTLTIQKNGASVGTFTANQSGNSTANITVPTKTSDISNDSGFITASDIPAINNGTLTIQKNGANVQTFTANSATDKTANIEVPTKTSELENDSGFIVNDTHAVCDEGGNITLDGTTVEPLVFDSLEGATSQQTYTGKNLLNYYANYQVGYSTTINGVTYTMLPDGGIRMQGKNNTSSNSSFTVVGSGWDGTTIQVPLDGSATYMSSISRPSNAYRWYIRGIGSGGSVITLNSNNNTVLISGCSGITYVMLQVAPNAEVNGVVYPMVEIGNQATSFEPYVGGVPAPNPDYPQAVQTVTGENVVKIEGKNLLYLSGLNATDNGVANTLNNDGSITCSGTVGSGWNGWTIMPYVPNSIQAGTYTLSIDHAINVGMNITFRDSSNTNIVAGNIPAGSTSATITLPRTAAKYSLWANGTTGTAISFTIKAQIELGSTATAFEPYQGQNYEVNLGDIELCKIGDYQDYIYKSGGKWYVHKECGKANLSSITWEAYAGTLKRSGINPIANMVYVANNQQVGAGLTEGFSIRKGGGLSDASLLGYFAIDTNRLAFNVGSGGSDPVGNLYYALATPTDAEITNEALVAQLEALWRADGYDGQTHITALYADGNAQMQLAVCQYPSHLPIATTSQLGAVIVGDGLQIEPDGRLDVIVDDELSTTSRNPVQNAVVTEALAGKANNADLSAVATTGSFNDLVDRPTIPTVNNATLTIQKNGTNVATFTANSSINATANITVPNITLTDVDPGEGGTLAANNFIGVYV